MASYAPPSNNLTIFNPDQFLTDSSLLEFPVAQGAETFPFGLTTSTATVVGALTAGGTSTLSTTNVSGQLTMGTANQILTNLQEGTTASTAVLLYSEGARNGAVNLGTGSTGKTITIGNSTASTLNLRGSTIDANIMNVSGTLTAGTFNPTTLTTNTITGTAVGTAVSLYNEGTRTGTINFGGGSSGKIINIGGGATTTQFSGTSITLPVVLVSGQATFQGNTQFGDAAGDSIVPNGTLTKPFIIGTYASQSSFSLSSITPVTTYLGGTLQTFNTFANVATGTFIYAMSSIPPYTAGGGLALTAGTYMFWMGINWEDSSAFNMTDCRMGLSNDGTLSAASSEAVLVSALPNLTCYFHKTDQADAAGTDSENRVLSSCFNIASATTVFPWWICNHSVTVDTVTVDVIFTKIGSA